MNDLKETCIKLNYLLEHTANVRFESGEEYSFILDKKYTEFEIESFEKAYQISLPEEYKYFLINVGASTLYIDEYGLGIKLNKLEDLEAFSKNVFLNMKNIFPDLLIIGSIIGRGDFLGFDLKGGRGCNGFSVFSHEDNPEKWLETNSSWGKFSTWLLKLVITDGEQDFI